MGLKELTFGQQAAMWCYRHQSCTADLPTNGEIPKHQLHRSRSGCAICFLSRTRNERKSRKVGASLAVLAIIGYPRHFTKPMREIVIKLGLTLPANSETITYQSQKREVSFSPMPTSRRKAKNNTPQKKQSP